MINKTNFIWIDGNFIPWDEAKTHVLDHSLHYGSAVFEGIKGYKTEDGVAIFRIDNHINRLFDSAAALDIKIPYDKQQLKSAIVELVRKNRLKNDFYIRPLIWLGSGDLKILPTNNPVRSMITVFERSTYYGVEGGVKVKTSPFMKPHPKSLPAGVKIVGAYVLSMLAQIDAKKSNVDDALMIDHNGYVVEGTAGNIFFVKDRKLFTPPLESGIIPGITRDSIMEFCKDLDLEVEEKKVKLKQLSNFDEVFLTGTASEITSILEIDGKKVTNEKSGKVAELIRKEYAEIVRGKKEKYRHWLTFV